MKKTILFAFLALCTILCSCGKQVEKTVESDSGNTENTTDDTPIAQVNSLYPGPDYDYQLALSDDLILGEVVEELGGRYSNPDNSIEGYDNMWKLQYSVRVDKSFKGYLKEGDLITVIVNSDSGLSPEDEEKMKSQSVITYREDCDGGYECTLKKGDKPVLMLEKSLFVTDEGENGYRVVFGKLGAFFPEENGTMAISENAETVYASPAEKIKLSDIPADIAAADELYGDLDENDSEL